ncbi:hypothetical protein Agub_g178 [Astrephomene gubernaculifera]|uniref:BZIP domain-containing protein n=1 Tax=Astrephomene gubernaculifera TaxID=47775 RepID=A0AAD3DEA7_9CHLO|nr:hypothetical protein Agub_g178 [Astrephomene gubernaculifera]
MNGQPALASGQQRGGAPANSQPMLTMWPSYYAAGAFSGCTSGSAEDQHPEQPLQDQLQEDEDAASLQREREQRLLKRKQANRESAKRSKLKRKQAERDLNEHARRVDEERDSLASQLAAAQQRYAEAHAKHMELRQKIQGYAVSPSGDGGLGGVGGSACG